MDSLNHNFSLSEIEIFLREGLDKPRDFCAARQAFCPSCRCGNTPRHCVERSDEAIHASASGGMDYLLLFSKTSNEPLLPAVHIEAHDHGRIRNQDGIAALLGR